MGAIGKLIFPHILYRHCVLPDPVKRNLRLNSEKDEPIKTRSAFLRRILRACNYFVISTDESFLFYWLMLLNTFVLYNLWFSIARQAFEPLQTDYENVWRIIDYIADSMYFIDIFIQFRTGYLEQGNENERIYSLIQFEVKLRDDLIVFFVEQEVVDWSFFSDT